MIRPTLVLSASLLALPFAPAASAGDTLSGINKQFDSKREEALDKIAKEQFAALEKWVAANGSAPDANKARMQLVELAAEENNWNAVIKYADPLIADENFGTMARFQKAQALGATGQSPAAIALMQEVAENAGDDINLAVESWMALADLHIDADNKEAAEAAYESLRSAITNPQAKKQIGQMVDMRIADLGKIGEPPTSFDVTGYDGKPLNLDQYKGKVTLIDFWATWCGPCVAELPNVIDAYEKYKDKGFDVIGISLDEDENAFRDFIADRGMTWRHFFDGKGWGNQVSSSYEISSIPATYLLDRDGNIFRIGARGPALHAAIEKALAKAQG